MSAVADTPLALEMSAYFAARRLCLAATPPCITRPCERHHAEATVNLGAVPCESCTQGLDAAGEPCLDCDGYSRIWPSVSAPASTLATGGPAAAGAGVDGASGLSASAGLAAGAPPSNSRPRGVRPGTPAGDGPAARAHEGA